jgi:V/A-type H+-transporting ATPase subunit E
MTAEKIIQQIKKDSEKEINQILNEAKSQASEIINESKKEAEQESKLILSEGKKQSENISKILVSKAGQDAKKEMMKAREEIIKECFIKAHHSLSTLNKEQYRTIVTKLIKNGVKKLGEQCTILVSRDIDNEIAEGMGLKISGTVETSGGVVLKSADGKITLDHTFDGILERKKNEIRIKVGMLLFPE